MDSIRDLVEINHKNHLNNYEDGVIKYKEFFRRYEFGNQI